MYDDSRRPPRQVGFSYYGKFVSFAVGCFVLTLMSDIAYWATASFMWETSSVWLLTIGLVSAGCAIPAAIIDLARRRTVFALRQSWLAVFGQVVAFALSVINVFVHSRDGYTAIVPQGLLLSALVVLILSVTTIAGRSAVNPKVAGGLA